MVKVRTRNRNEPNVPANSLAQRPNNPTNTRKRKAIAVVTLLSAFAISTNNKTIRTKGKKKITVETTVKKR
jgi:hypothetical protein